MKNTAKGVIKTNGATNPANVPIRPNCRISTKFGMNNTMPGNINPVI